MLRKHSFVNLRHRISLQDMFENIELNFRTLEKQVKS